MWMGMDDLGESGGRCGVSLYVWTGVEDISRNRGKCGGSVSV